MFGLFLLALAVAFLVYAGVVHYRNTDATQPVQKRALAAIIAAGMALGSVATSYMVQWFGQ
jgi:hypothetical protein